MNLNSDAMFVTGARDEEIAERDPVTTLFPCALSAYGESSDLYTIYYVIRRHPGVLDCINQVEGGISRRKRRRSPCLPVHSVA